MKNEIVKSLRKGAIFLVRDADDISTIKLARELFNRKNVGSIYALSIQRLVLVVVASACKIEVAHAALKQSATVIPMVWTSQFIGRKIIVLLIKIPTVN